MSVLAGKVPVAVGGTPEGGEVSVTGFLGGKMGKTIFAATLVAGLCLSSPAIADKTYAVTPSGTAEMLFPGKPETVVGAISSKCIDVKWTVVNTTSNEVTCEAPLNFGQSVLGQMLMGNSYSTAPRRFFRYNVAEVNGISRVQAAGWMELQMAFGQVKRTDFSGPEFINGAMTFLGGAGGKLPPGTTFPNHVLLGVDFEDTVSGGYTVLTVTKIYPGLPAEKAGIQVGDVVTRIANKRFKNSGDYLDATARAAEKPAYEVELTRGGKVMKLTLARSFRPTWAEQVVATAEPEVPKTAAAALSVADELAKLAKLRADGIITQAEFDSQKAKLLAQ